MRPLVGVLACLGIGAMTVSLADPQAPAQAPPAAATVPAAETALAAETAPAATSTAPASTSAAAASSASASAATHSRASAANPVNPTPNAEEKRLIAMGYRPEMRNGEKIFCRVETELGSRFTTKHCARADELKAMTRDAQDTMEKVQRTQVPPMGN